MHQAPKALETPAVKIPKPVALQKLIITIWPFASIIINGKYVANDVKHHRVKLEPGLHRLKFTHPYAATVEKIVHIKTPKEALELFITMKKSKPAFLIIRSEPEANVAVNGILKA